MRPLVMLGIVLLGGLSVGPLGLSAHVAEDIVHISITDDGFIPTEVTVHRGTTVVWTNNGEEPHWPASAIHPTHSAYPVASSEDCLGSSFDACRGLLPGESYSFQFMEVGRWGFHDHLVAHLTGVVDVVGDGDAENTPGFFERLGDAIALPFQKIVAWWKEHFTNPGEAFGLREMERGEDMVPYIREIMAGCNEQGGQGRCYEAVALLLMKKRTLGEVMEAMREAEAYPEVHNRCHEVSHFLAREGYEDTGSVGESYAMCTEACWGGCYHGVMEQHFFEKEFSLTGEDDERIRAEMTTICGTKENYEVPGEFYECLHGLGHAMMFITNADVPKSLAYCDLLGKEEYARACYGGVFMENSSSSTNRDHPSAYLDPNDPLYPCTILDEHYLPTCYHYQSSYFSVLANYDWEKVSTMCKTVPSPYQKECFNMIGSNQVGFTQDYAVMEANCSLVPGEFFDDCIRGAAGSIGVRFKEEPGRMLAFCKEVPGSVQPACYEQAAWTELSLREDRVSLETLCGSIEDEANRNACLTPLR